MVGKGVGGVSIFSLSTWFGQLLNNTSYSVPYVTDKTSFLFRSMANHVNGHIQIVKLKPHESWRLQRENGVTRVAPSDCKKAMTRESFCGSPPNFSLTKSSVLKPAHGRIS